MSDNDAVDLDLAIMLITAPVWITGFIVLIVAGWRNDRAEEASTPPCVSR